MLFINFLSWTIFKNIFPVGGKDREKVKLEMNLDKWDHYVLHGVVSFSSFTSFFGIRQTLSTPKYGIFDCYTDLYMHPTCPCESSSHRISCNPEVEGAGTVITLQGPRTKPCRKTNHHGWHRSKLKRSTEGGTGLTSFYLYKTTTQPHRAILVTLSRVDPTFRLLCKSLRLHYWLLNPKRRIST